MKEIFVLYEISTGCIIRYDKVDKSIPLDGSTIYDQILGKTNDPNVNVLYFPLGKLKDKDLYEVIDGSVKLRAEPYVSPRVVSENLISAHIRAEAIKDLINKGELPEDYI